MDETSFLAGHYSLKHWICTIQEYCLYSLELMQSESYHSSASALKLICGLFLDISRTLCLCFNDNTFLNMFLIQVQFLESTR